MPLERRFLGIVDVDSATLLIGDPAYVLPSRADGKEGVDYEQVRHLDLMSAPAFRLAGMPVVLVVSSDGDGTFPVFAEYEDGELMRVVIEFLGPDED